MTIEQNKQVVLRFNKEFLEQGSAAILDEIVDKNFINHTAPVGIANDVSGLIQFMNMFHKGFSDVSIEILDQIGEKDTVATRKTIQAIHTGEIMGRPATGKRVIMNVIDIVRLKDGKYTDHWGRNDILQVIQSL